MGMRPIGETMGKHVEHRTNTSLKNGLEQDHRGIQQRDAPLGGFQTVKAAARFCGTCDEIRHSLRPRRRMGEVVSLLEPRQTFVRRLAA
jgi:putative transposase